MTYEYKCDNKECKNYNKEIEITRSIYRAADPVYCKECGSKMIRVYNFGCKTSDGIKCSRNDDDVG